MSGARTTSRRWTALFTTLAVACAMFALFATPAFAEPPSNDLIENATVIGSLPFSTSYSTQDSTRSPDDPGASCISIGGTVTTWLRYDAPADQSVRLSVSGPGLFQFFEGSPGSLTELACGNTFPQALPLVGGHTYYVMVSELFPSNVSVSLRTAEVPASDLIENATVIESLPSSTTTAIIDATHSDTDPSSCGSGPTTWARYDAPADQLVRASVTGAPGEFSLPNLAVFEGAPGSLVQVACNPGAPLSLVSGHTYSFMVSSSFNATATLSLRLATPPANDLIENASVITTLPFTATPPILDATGTPSDPPASCTFGAVPNVWFRYDATATQVLRVNLTGGGSVPLAVYQGTPGALTQVACGSGQQTVPVTAGQSYYLMVPASLGTITLNLSVATPPANDLIENASVIGSLPFSASPATVDASRSASDPASCLATAPNVWYRYDSASSQALRVTLTSNFGSSLAVFEGSPGSLTQVACGSSSPVVVPVTAGHSYYVMVPVLSGGTATLAVQVATPPANDLIEHASVIGSLPFSTTPSVVDASRSASDPAASCIGAVPNVWYRYDASSSQSLLTTFTASFSFPFAVFEGSPGSLTQVVCGSGTQPLAVTAGHTYYFMVPAIPGGTFALRVTTPPANDLIEHATVIDSLPSSVSQPAQDATASASDPPACSFGAFPPTVWYRYDAPAPQVVRVTFSSSAAVMVVYQGAPSSLSPVACVSPGSQTLTLSGGQSYYFMVATSFPSPITVGVELVDRAPSLSVPGDMAVDATSPAGAVVEYGATATDDHDWFPVVACDPPSGSTLAIGTTAVDCVATDNAGLSSPHAGFAVHVAGAGEQLERLRADVTRLSSKPLRTTLGLSLKAAANALDTGRPIVACVALTAFVLEARLVPSKVLSTDIAQRLIADATRIRQVIGCTV